MPEEDDGYVPLNPSDFADQARAMQALDEQQENELIDKAMIAIQVTDEDGLAMTVEEMRDAFMQQIVAMGEFWATATNISILGEETEAKARCRGLIHSILVIFDGGSILPAFDIIPSPHPDDKAYCIENDEKYWVEEVINDTQLHENLRPYYKERQ